MPASGFASRTGEDIWCLPSAAPSANLRRGGIGARPRLRKRSTELSWITPASRSARSGSMGNAMGLCCPLPSASDHSVSVPRTSRSNWLTSASSIVGFIARRPSVRDPRSTTGSHKHVSDGDTPIKSVPACRPISDASSYPVPSGNFSADNTTLNRMSSGRFPLRPRSPPNEIPSRRRSALSRFRPFLK